VTSFMMKNMQQVRLGEEMRKRYGATRRYKISWECLFFTVQYVAELSAGHILYSRWCKPRCLNRKQQAILGIDLGLDLKAIKLKEL